MDLHNSYHFKSFRLHGHHTADFKKGTPLHYLLLVLKGSGEIITQTETLQLHPGALCYIPKGLRCHSSWQGDPQIEFLCFGFLTFPPAQQRAYTLQVIPQAEPLISMLKSIPQQDTQISCESFCLFYTVLSEAASRMAYSKSTASCKIAEYAMGYIRQHPHAAISEISHICGVSQSHLYAEFRKATGTTPNKFRNRILCDRAVELLTTTEMTVEDISDKLNFSSPSYFRKVIRQVTGRTPRQIRANKESN